MVRLQNALLGCNYYVSGRCCQLLWIVDPSRLSTAPFFTFIFISRLCSAFCKKKKEKNFSPRFFAPQNSLEIVCLVFFCYLNVTLGYIRIYGSHERASLSELLNRGFYPPAFPHVVKYLMVVVLLLLGSYRTNTMQIVNNKLNSRILDQRDCTVDNGR